MPFLEALATAWIEDLVDNGQPDPVCRCAECTLALAHETNAILTYLILTGRGGIDNDRPDR